MVMASSSRLWALVVVALATSVIAMVGAAPALATQPIETFEVSTSTTQAGGHPDLQTKFTLGDPGEPEAAKNVIVNLPRDCSATRTRSRPAPRATSLSTECPTSSQAG